MTRVIFIAAMLGALVVAALPEGALAESRTISGGVRQTNDTGEEKIDFHIVVRSPDTIIDCVGEEGEDLGGRLKVDDGDEEEASVDNNNTNEVTLKWELIDIPEGSTVKACWTCKEEEKNSYTVESYFTPEGSPTDSPTLGWRVTPTGSVFLANAYPEAIEFENLRVQFPIDVTTDSMFALLESPLAGVPASVTWGTVPAGGERVVDGIPLPVGGFLTARLDTSFQDPGFSSLVATVVVGHEHQQYAVGGIAAYPDLADASLQTEASPGGSSALPYAVIAAGVAAAAFAIAAGGWYYARRREM